MLMLKLIGLIAAAIALYHFILWFNHYTAKHANYEFFTFEHSLAVIGSYVLIYIGIRWIYRGDDWLNGAIVLGFGVIILTWVIVNNYLSTPRLFATAGSLAQLVLYVPLALVALVVVFLAIAAGSQIKPVYSINAKD